MEIGGVANDELFIEHHSISQSDASLGRKADCLNATDTFTDLHTLLLLNPQVQSFSWSRRRSKSQRVLALVAWLFLFCAFWFFFEAHETATDQLLNFFTPFSNSNIDFSSSEHLTLLFLAFCNTD